MSEFKCYKCGLIKDLSDFFKDKTHSNGHRSICKICDKKRKFENAQKTENRLRHQIRSKLHYLKNKNNQFFTIFVLNRLEHLKTRHLTPFQIFK